jgi:hypothetical protein
MYGERGEGVFLEFSLGMRCPVMPLVPADFNVQLADAGDRRCVRMLTQLE